MNKKNKPKMKKTREPAILVTNYENICYWVNKNDPEIKPEEGQLVLAVYDLAGYKRSIPNIACYRKGRFIVNDPIPYFPGSVTRLCITHWMPLPEFDNINKNEGELR